MRILRGLSARTLHCGCTAGVYETYDGEIVAIIDAHASVCADAAHALGKLIPAGPRTAPSATDDIPKTPRPH
jgi:hypothetical protein